MSCESLAPLPFAAANTGFFVTGLFCETDSVVPSTSCARPVAEIHDAKVTPSRVCTPAGGGRGRGSRGQATLPRVPTPAGGSCGGDSQRPRHAAENPRQPRRRFTTPRPRCRESPHQLLCATAAEAHDAQVTLPSVHQPRWRPMMHRSCGRRPPRSAACSHGGKTTPRPWCQESPYEQL